MIVYSFAILVILLFDSLCSRYKFSYRMSNFFALAVLLVLALISAIRYGIGTDYKHYQDIYHWVNNPQVNRQYEELGFRLFNKFLYMLHLSDRWVFVISAVLLSVAIYVFLIEYINRQQYFMFIFLYVCSGMYFSSMNIVRQYIALSFVLFAIVLFYRNFYFPSIIFLLLGLLNHKSCIILLIPLFACVLVNRKNFSKILMFGYVSAALIYFLGVDSITMFVIKIVPSWRGYYQSQLTNEINALALFKVIVPNLLFVYGFVRSKSTRELFNDEQRYSFSNFSAIACMIYCFCSIAFAGNLVYTRLGEYFIPFYFVYVLYLLDSVSKKEQFIIKSLIICYYMLSVIVTIFIMGGYGVMPYETFIEF